jgi:lathosterol oxidase
MWFERLAAVGPVGIFAFFLVAQIARYVAFSGGVDLILAYAPASWLEAHRFQDSSRKPEDLRREVRYSLSTILIYSVIYAFIFAPSVRVHTRIYWQASEFGWIWFAASLPLLIVLHDTYFYWMHRFLHHPRMFARVHRIHHLSGSPSAWASQAFHPLEAFFEMIWIVPTVFLMPLDFRILIAFSFFSFASNTLGHSEMNAVPIALREAWPMKAFNTSSEHHGHHRSFRENYGLYFRFWDRVMGTG